MSVDLLCRQAAMRAAHDVAGVLRAAFRTEMSGEEKTGQRDLVTEYDMRAEREIIARISREVPDSCFLGEEGGRLGEGSIEWIIDPIDGTDNFARGIPFWCVSIAATRGGRVIAGVVLDPIGGDVFSSDAGGAYLGDMPMRVRAAAGEREATLVTAFPQARDFENAAAASREAIETLTTTFRSVRNLGSAALGLAYVAAGWADATFNFGVRAWDVAAGAHLVDRAGGRYVSVGASRSALTPDIHSGHYAAYGRAVPYPTLEAVCRDIAASYASASPAAPAVSLSQ